MRDMIPRSSNRMMPDLVQPQCVKRHVQAETVSIQHEGEGCYPNGLGYILFTVLYFFEAHGLCHYINVSWVSLTELNVQCRYF